MKKLLFIALLGILSGCMCTKTAVGGYQQQQGKSYTYGKAHQMWLFWGLISIGRTTVATPPDGRCQVITRRNFGDCLITILTAGILTTETIKVEAKK